MAEAPSRRSTLGMWLALATVLGAFTAATAWQEVRAPSRAPPFTLTSTGLEGGVAGDPVTFSLSDYAGRTVVLDLMAVSCAPCRTVTEETLKPLHERHRGDPDFVLLSIDTWAGSGNAFGGETDDALRQLQRDTGASWRHARDTDEVYRKYGAVALPKVVVVDGGGDIVYARRGLQDPAGVEAAVRASLAGEAQPVPVFQAGRVALAAVAGVAAFFAPCCVGLLPAYLGLLARGGEAGSRDASAPAARRAVAGGLRVAAALVATEAALALLLFLFRPALAPRLPQLAVATAALLILVGALTLAGFPWDRLLPARGRAAPGAWGFGAAYGAAAFGCTGPVLLPLLLGGFAESASEGVAVLAAYAAAVAACALAVAILVASGHDGPLRAVLRHTRLVNRAAAALLILGGAWILWVEWRAGLL